MANKKNKRLRLLSFVVIGYMLLALAWWSYLLYLKNNDAFLAKTELLRITKSVDGSPLDMNILEKDLDYLALKEKYKKQERMILGEASVLALSLIIGIWFINRGYQRQTEAARQSRNFLLSITHELKSPLASIKLILQTFSKRKLDQERIAKFSGNALNEAERLESLVNNLLLAARMETTNVEVDKEHIELYPLLDGIRENILTKHKDVVLELSLDEQASIFADHKSLVSIFINLIENAIKYSDQEKHIQIKHTQKGKYDELTIADHGWGIPDSEKKKVFEKFYRIGNEDTRKTKGTGLGLYIIQQMVLAHQGKISIGNHQPKGTVFTIQLPKAS